MRLLITIFIILIFLQANAEQSITTIKSESSNEIPIVLVSPIFFSNSQIVLPNEFNENIKMVIETNLYNGNYLDSYPHQQFILKLVAFKNIPSQNQYTNLFNQIRNIEPPIEVQSELLQNIDESLIIANKTYLLIGQLEQFSFTQYVDYIESNNATSYINNLLIQVRYYIISLTTKKYLGSFIATGDAGIAKIGDSLDLDYKINQLTTDLFSDLKYDTINNIVFINNRYYDSYKDNLETD